MSGNEGKREPSSGETSFEGRLRAAREKQGLDAQAAAPSSGAGSSAGPTPMGVGMRVSVELVSALAVAVAIGWYLDKWLHTSPLFLIVFVLLGGGAGIANVWRMMGPRRPPH